MTLIFDFDGTIVDSSLDVLASLDFALRSVGLVPTRALDSTLIGPPLTIMIREAVNNVSDRDLNRAVTAFRQHYDASEYSCTVLYPGIAELLKAAGEIGARAFIATNKPRQATVAILERLGVVSAFSDILCLDDCRATDKIDLIGELLRRHGPASNGGWMIGDAVGDIRAGKVHRLKTVAHLGGYSAPELLLAEHPDFAIDSMNQLLSLLYPSLACDGSGYAGLEEPDSEGGFGR
jgi:phosphoglycolate phosphatase